MNEFFVLCSCSSTHGYSYYPAAEKTNKVNDNFFICHCEKMWITNLMAVPFSSVSYRGDVVWMRVKASSMMMEGAKDEQSRRWTDGDEDGQSQKWEGVGDAKSHVRT